MKQSILWFDRKFQFDHLKGTFPSIYERLSGLMPRLEHLLQAIPVTHLDQRPQDKWSIKEQIGHLLDLEELWIARMTDFRDGAEVLTEADLSNAKTHAANHNSRSLESLLQDLKAQREVLLAVCREIETKAETLTSLHPRLRQPMRVIDLAYFVAEHDDHHLADMRRIHHLLK